MTNHQDIRIGTLAPASEKTPDYIRQILPYGFESFSLTFGQSTQGLDLRELAREVRDVLGDKAIISSLGLYGNPLQDEGVCKEFPKLMEACEWFGCDIVAGFAGALEDVPVSESIPKFTEVWGELARRAEDCGIRVAFENCDMKGTWQHPRWNIAHSPYAWELMFDAVPSPALGLEWEPCHQLVSLVEPLPQLRQWLPKVYHVHGKDATIDYDALRRFGIRGGKPYIAHRTPGFGDTNWTDVISILREGGFRGCIDIEGWHDPVYKNELEMTGQVHALRYLKQCRGGDFIPNPV